MFGWFNEARTSASRWNRASRSGSDAGAVHFAHAARAQCGGLRFGEDLGTEFAGVADERHSQYLIGFAPPKRDGRVHDIEAGSRNGG